MILNFPIRPSTSVMAQLAEARRQREELLAQLSEHDRLEQELLSERQNTPPWAATKTRQWEVEELLPEAAQMLDEQVSIVIEQYEQLLSGADPAPAPTETAILRQELLALCWLLLTRAEERGEGRQSARFTQLLQQHDVDGQYGDLIEGSASVSIESEPHGAKVRLFELTTKDRRVVRGERRELGKTPVTSVQLSPGRYLLEIRLRGHALVRRPLLVSRGAQLKLQIRLFRNRRVGAEFIHVSAGRFRFGGDQQARCAHCAMQPFVDNFAIARQPVTVGEYLLFLDDLASQDPARALALTPQRAAGCVDPRLPVAGVTLEAARAYCAWVSDSTGVEHRLPTEREWEKAARGVDGRLFPWGDRFDPTFCHSSDSEQGRLRLRPIGSFADDVSPYGAIDFGGSVAEWTDSAFGDGPTTDSGPQARLMVVRGGSFMQGETASRCASRRPAAANQGLPDVGFRLLRPLPAGGGERVVPPPVPAGPRVISPQPPRPSVEQANRELLAICRDLLARTPGQGVAELLSGTVALVGAERGLLLERGDALVVRHCRTAGGEPVPRCDQKFDAEAAAAALDQQRVISLRGSRPLLALPLPHHRRRFCLLLERRFSARPFSDTDRLLAEMGADLLALPLRLEQASFERKPPVVGQTLAEAVAEVERDLIGRTLTAEAGNISRTARRLGLSRNGLRARMRRNALSSELRD